MDFGSLERHGELYGALLLLDALEGGFGGGFGVVVEGNGLGLGLFGGFVGGVVAEIRFSLGLHDRFIATLLLLLLLGRLRVAYLVLHHLPRLILLALLLKLIKHLLCVVNKEKAIVHALADLIRSSFHSVLAVELGALFVDLFELVEHGVELGIFLVDLFDHVLAVEVYFVGVVVFDFGFVGFFE